MFPRFFGERLDDFEYFQYVPHLSPPTVVVRMGNTVDLNE
jgi:hypothetical protein